MLAFVKVSPRPCLLALAAAIVLLSCSCGKVYAPRLFAVTHGNGRFVAIGEGGVIVTSEDLNKWTAAESGSTANLTDVEFGNGRFVAVGDTGTVLISEDGLAWTALTTPTSKDLRGLTFFTAGSLWISVGESGEVSTSTDALTWTVRHSGSGWLSAVAASDGGLLAVEAGAAGELSSSDGINWTRTAQPLGGRCGVAYANGTWVSADFDGNIQRRPSQASSAVWQTPASGMWSAGYDCDVAAGDDFFVVASAFLGSLFTSPDGRVWTKQFTSKNALRGITVLGPEVLTVGSFGEIAHAQCPGGACGDFTQTQISVPGEEPSAATPTDPGTGSLCAYWSCGGSPQCATVMGAATGKQCTFAPGQTCEQWCAATIPGNCSCR